MPKQTAFTPAIESFIETFVKDIADGTAAIFAGAGLSVDSGYVNWKELLRGIATELGLDVDRESNLVDVAQFHLNERAQNRTEINQTLIEQFSSDHQVNSKHRILARLPIATYWTTNYDHMIETALAEAGKVVDVKRAVADLKRTQRGRAAVVYKMHGDVNDPDHAILTKDDYEGYFRRYEPFVTLLAGDLVAKTMLFVGFSFTDPNIDYIMSRVRVSLERKPRQHYCILREEARRKGETAASFEYRMRRQDYVVKDLMRIGIRALLVKEYHDVDRILRAIEQRYRTRTVFISGSAHDFGEWRPDEAGLFIEKLSAALIRKGYSLVTGFGLGVGPSVVAGALQEIRQHPKRYPESRLQAFPFPYLDNGTSSRERARAYETHRRRIIDRAGIAIFLFGNKRTDHGDLIEADGVFQEHTIAQELEVNVVPVGATGWVAQAIGHAMRDRLAKRSAAFKEAFAIAQDASYTIDTLVDAVVTMVDEYHRSAR